MTECEKSGDGLHHYTYAQSQHAIYVENGDHSCYVCVFCADPQCVTQTFPKRDPLKLPTLEQLRK